MKYIAPLSSLTAALAFASSLCLTPTSLVAQDDGSEPKPQDAAPQVQEVSPELMRSFLHLQEQVHATQMAVERSRLESDAAAARNAEALNARLGVIEKALDQAHKDNSTAVQEASRQIRESNSHMMLLAGIFAAIGFLAIGVTGWLQWKTASRLSTLPSQMGYPALLPAQGYGALNLTHPGAKSQSVRLMDAMGRLEHRIADLEVGHPDPTSSGDALSATSASTDSEASAELASLIREGEELLAHEEAEKAIEHFDGILAKHPGHPEVLLHKGAALEQVQRDQEAIECYDEAIRADKTLTMAYLHKGGLYNRMEKFDEAMACYEQALKVQEGRTPIS